MIVALWEGLAEATQAPQRAPADLPGSEDLSALRRRQERGEIAPHFDPGLAMLAFMGASLAPTTMPHIVCRITGLDSHAPAFKRLRAELLERMARHLRG